MGPEAYLLCLQRVIGCLDGHVLDAADLDAVDDDLLGFALVREGGSDGLALALRDLGVLSVLCPSVALAAAHPPSF